MKLIKLLLTFITALFLTFSAQAIERNLGDNWCSDVRIHFFAGGAEGDGFAGIVQTGAENAIRDTGANAEILYVSKEGSDSSGDGSWTSPFESIQKE